MDLAEILSVFGGLPALVLSAAVDVALLPSVLAEVKAFCGSHFWADR